MDCLDGLKSGVRDARGRFAKGNPGGPGRPPRPVEATYLRALSDACPIAVWREIAQKAVEQARQGNSEARAWLSKYLLGSASLRETLTSEEEMAHELARLEEPYRSFSYPP